MTTWPVATPLFVLADQTTRSASTQVPLLINDVYLTRPVATICCAAVSPLASGAVKWADGTPFWNKVPLTPVNVTYTVLDGASVLKPFAQTFARKRPGCFMSGNSNVVLGPDTVTPVRPC